MEAVELGWAAARASVHPATPPARAPIASKVALGIGFRVSFEAAPRALCFAVVLTALRARVFLSEDEVVLRINATPLQPGDGSQLAEEVLQALRRTPSAAANGSPVLD